MTFSTRVQFDRTSSFFIKKTTSRVSQRFFKYRINQNIQFYVNFFLEIIPVFPLRSVLILLLLSKTLLCTAAADDYLILVQAPKLAKPSVFLRSQFFLVMVSESVRHIIYFWVFETSFFFFFPKRNNKFCRARQCIEILRYEVRHY